MERSSVLHSLLFLLLLTQTVCKECDQGNVGGESYEQTIDPTPYKLSLYASPKGSQIQEKAIIVETYVGEVDCYNIKEPNLRITMINTYGTCVKFYKLNNCHGKPAFTFIANRSHGDILVGSNILSAGPC